MEEKIYKEDIINNIKKYYDNMCINSCKDIEGLIKNNLDNCGIMYRIFSRKKSMSSVTNKMDKKAEIKYIPNNQKMQDLIGVRIVLYFKDDIDISIKTLQNIFLEEGREHDQPDSETFKPQRVNYVFKIPDCVSSFSDEISEACYIDKTFEVQFRTIFSEGWHEVEHDIRYKYKSEWDMVSSLSRELNGILAVLEICDNDIIAVTENLAYKKYKDKHWESMIRNKFRLRFNAEPLNKELLAVLNSDNDLSKTIFRFNRDRLIDLFCYTSLPISCNNAIYLMNEDQICNEMIQSKTPLIVKRKYQNANIPE